MALGRTAVAMVLLAAAACGARQAATGERQQAVVTKVVDGDTVWLRGVGAGPVPRGQAARVRVLDIDTPEVAAYGGQAGCWGDRAWAYARAVLAPGTQVDVLAGPRARVIATAGCCCTCFSRMGLPTLRRRCEPVTPAPT